MDNERERKRREKGREKEEKKFSHCSYDRITRNSSSSRKQQRTYKLIPFSSLLLVVSMVVHPADIQVLSLFKWTS